MSKSRFEIFLIISILFHLIILLLFNKVPTESLNTKLAKKNKEKKPIRVKFIELPDKLKEIKHKEKTPYISQKSYKAKKQTKKENPLIKNKSIEIADNIPKFLPPKPKIQPSPSKKAKPKKEQKPITKQKKIVQKQLKQKTKKLAKTKTKQIKKEKLKKTILKPKLKPKSKPIEKLVKNKNKKTIISLNKLNPSLEELLKSELVKKNNIKSDNSSSKSSEKNNPLNESAPPLQPNIFKPSHVYPDDIDISDSISISTQSSRFASYLHKVKRKIELVWEYPRIAGEMGIQGRLFLKFEIDRTGKLKMIKLLKSSGAKILDDEAIRAVKEAAPYPPFPKDFKIKSIKIHACFDYIIVGKEIW